MPPSVARSASSTAESQLLDLPLNIIVLIVSHVDRVADLARLVQSCRVLRYMALPQLYTSVCLYSYSEVRYVNGRPEGFGSSSPFSTALNTLVTRNVVSLVKHFSLSGEMREYDLEECAKVGRVSDSSMILNSLVRCAIDRMPILETFSWELSTKLCHTVYEGLRAKVNLKALTIRFPSTRTARPKVLIPAFPNLERLKVTHIDPLCYPDDISLLLFESPKLNDLRLAWSPRMRLESEPSVNLQVYFGRCLKGGRKLHLKNLAFLDLYTDLTLEATDIFDTASLQNVTILNSTSGALSDQANVFLDNSWRTNQNHRPNVDNVKSIRFNNFYSADIDLLFSVSKNLENLYFVNARPLLYTPSSQPSPSTHNSGTPTNSGLSTATSPVHFETYGAHLAQDEYLHIIKSKHGSTLRHLLLPVQWVLTIPEIKSLGYNCPNIEQLGLTIEIGRDGFHTTHALIQEVLNGFPKLVALRMLQPWEHSGQRLDSFKLDPLNEAMGRGIIAKELTKSGCTALKWITGPGGTILKCDRVFEAASGPGQPKQWSYVVKAGGEEVSKSLEVWSMDSLEI